MAAVVAPGILVAVPANCQCYPAILHAPIANWKHIKVSLVGIGTDIKSNVCEE